MTDAYRFIPYGFSSLAIMQGPPVKGGEPLAIIPDNDEAAQAVAARMVAAMNATRGLNTGFMQRGGIREALSLIIFLDDADSEDPLFLSMWDSAVRKAKALLNGDPVAPVVVGNFSIDGLKGEGVEIITDETGRYQALRVQLPDPLSEPEDGSGNGGYHQASRA